MQPKSSQHDDVKRWPTTDCPPPSDWSFGRRAVASQASEAALAMDRAASQGMLVGLDQTGHAAMILDGDGRVVAMNRLAEKYVSHTICIRDGRLSGPPCADSERLEMLVSDVVRSATRPGKAPIEITVVLQPDGIPLIVRAAAIGPADGAVFTRTKILVTFTSTDLEVHSKAPILRKAFGLTATEASVALALTDGASARAIAEDRGVSVATIRSHLKTIFIKTQTKRQATLVGLVIKLQGIAASEA